MGEVCSRKEDELRCGANSADNRHRLLKCVRPDSEVRDIMWCMHPNITIVSCRLLNKIICLQAEYDLRSASPVEAICFQNVTKSASVGPP